MMVVSAGEVPEMQDLVLRFGVLVLVAALGWAIVVVVRRFIEGRRQVVLARQSIPGVQYGERPVTLLVFSSEDCRPCHTLQAPAIQRVLRTRGEIITVQEIDAPSSPDLTAHYSVLTVPTTVLLDTAGKARSVNYGFADEHTLLRQIDDIVAQPS
jgi:hypothetical protein